MAVVRLIVGRDSVAMPGDGGLRRADGGCDGGCSVFPASLDLDFAGVKNFAIRFVSFFDLIETVSEWRPNFSFMRSGFVVVDASAANGLIVRTGIAKVVCSMRMSRLCEHRCVGAVRVYFTNRRGRLLVGKVEIVSFA